MANSELLERQQQFSRSVALLILHADRAGYGVTLGECYRSNEQAEINALGHDGREQLAQLVERAFPLLAKKIRDNVGNGSRNSVHMNRLAVDLQLFEPGGRWITERHPYEQLAEFWESLGPHHRAGVRWGDAPHFSIEWQGVK